MVKRSMYIIASILILALGNLNAQTISWYEYWMDGEYASRTRTNTTNGSIEIEVNVQDKSPGMHLLFFRAGNTAKESGTLYRYLVYIPETIEKSKNNIVYYESWIDDDYANKVISNAESDLVNVSNVFDVTNLSEGLHFYHFRAKSSNAEYSQLYEYLIYIPEAHEEINTTISQYEYWLDNDYSSKKLVNVETDEVGAIESLDVSNHEPGIHTFYVRAKNVSGQFSAPKHYLVYIPEASEPSKSPIVGYSYTFNNIKKYRTIDETDSYNMYSYKFSIPELLDMTRVNNNCLFTLNADSVKMTRTSNICFGISFKNKNEKWSMPEPYQYSQNDTITKSWQNMDVNKICVVDKVKQGDFAAIKFELDKDGAYYLTTNQYCDVDLYDEDGDKINSISYENLSNSFSIGLSEGTYYAIVYNTIKDNNYPSEKLNLKISTKRESINDDVVETIYNDDSSEIVELYKTSNISLVDVSKSVFVSNHTDVNSITYTRTFANTSWQPLYIPFSLAYSDWSEDFEIAKINALVQYDDNQDGEADRNMLEIIKLKNGQTSPNTPYFIRTKSTGKKTITTSIPEIYNTEVNSIDCSTTDVKFTFTGTYKSISSDSLRNDYTFIMSGGQFMKIAKGSKLNPYRWFLTVEDRNGVIQRTGLAKVNCLDDEITGIENVNVGQQPVAIEYYSISGARLSVPEYGKVNVIRYSDGKVVKKLIK